MTDPGEPTYPDVYLLNGNGIAWTGEKSLMGVSYAFPGWYRRDDHGVVSWELYDAYRVLWTMGPRWSLSRRSQEPDAMMLKLRPVNDQWWLTEGSYGWTLDLVKSRSFSIYQDTAMPYGADALPVADRIIRNIVNRNDMLKGDAPEIRPSALRDLDIGKWQQSTQPLGTLDSDGERLRG